LKRGVSMNKRITNEVIIDALLNQGSIKAAAAAIGCTEVTIYKRMKNDAFSQQYKIAKLECVKATTAKLQYTSLSAVNTLSAIMEDDEIAPQVRINAANTILNYTAKFTEGADLLDRIEELEAEIQNEKH